MRRILSTQSVAWLIAMLLLGTTARAEPVVVVNARSGVERLSQDEVVNIFLGRYRKLPTGVAALPVDQPEGSALRAEFYRRLVNKELNEINAYWSRLVFSGKTSPPKQTASTSEVVSILNGTAGSIAYIERSQVDSRFRIVLELPR
jgi:ABC-type phosphate transport system substrate-binding protein